MSILSQSDLNLLRTQPHKSTLYLSIYNPRTIFSCQISDVTAARESRIMNYSNPSGAYTQVYANMLGLVGSTPGASDLGTIRVRSLTSGSVTVAENSDILWSSGTYLTILNYIEIDAIYPKITVAGTSTTFYKDTDIPYTNQNTILGTLVCAGPHRAATLKNGQPAQLYWSSSGTVNVLNDALSYTWFFEGGTPTGSLSKDPGYVQYAQAGDYKTVLTVSGTNGEVDTTMRFVSIRNDPAVSGTYLPITAWELREFTGSRSEGGYTGKIRVRDITVAGIRPNALIVLYSDDWFGGTNKSIGGNAENCQSIFFVGYIVKDTIYYNYQDNYVEFDVASVAGQMKDAVGFSISAQNKVTPKTWYEIVDMDIQKCLYHFLRWQSTVLNVTDFRYTGPLYSLQYFDTSRDSLYDAVNKFLQSAIIGELVADRQGALWAEVDPAGTTAARTAFPVNMQMGYQDWMNTPQLTMREYREVSYVTMGGVAYSGRTGTSAAYLACAPGISPSYRGKVASEIEGTVILSQSQLNQLVGNWFAENNSTYPQLTLEMAGNYRNLDIAPVEATQVSIASKDTPRGVVLVNEPFHNVSMEWKYDGETSRLYANKYELAQLQNGIPGDTIVIPPVSNINIPPIAIPVFNFPTIVPPIVPGLTANILGLVYNWGIVYTTTASTSGTTSWNSMNGGLTSPTTVVNIEVSASGKCYCQVGTDSIWYAPQPGAAWTKIVEAGSLVGGFGSAPNPPSAPGVFSFCWDLYNLRGGNWEFGFFRQPMILGFGINRAADDELFVVPGALVTVGNSLVMYVYLGSSQAMSIIYPNHWNNDTSSNASTASLQVTFGNSQWLVTWAATDGVNYAIFPEGGLNLVFAGSLNPPLTTPNQSQSRSRLAAQTAIAMSQTALDITQDGGTTWHQLTGSFPPVNNPNYYEFGYTNPNGGRVAVCTVTGTWGSQNSGLNWSRWTMTGAAQVQLSLWNLSDDNDWLFAEAGKVRYTPDFGVSMQDLTGNLPIILSGTTFQISRFRNY